MIIGKDFLIYAPVNNVTGFGLTITLHDKLGNLDYIQPKWVDTDMTVQQLCKVTSKTFNNIH